MSKNKYSDEPKYPDQPPSLARYVHTADVLRLLLIYKFGGFHLDTDFVILKSLVGLTNVVASDTAEGTFRHLCGAFRLVEILNIL